MNSSNRHIGTTARGSSKGVAYLHKAAHSEHTKKNEDLFVLANNIQHVHTDTHIHTHKHYTFLM